MTEKGKLIQGEQLQQMLKGSTRPVFPEGAPSWYPEFSRAVYTNLHAAATGSKSVAAAIECDRRHREQPGRGLVTRRASSVGDATPAVDGGGPGTAAPAGSRAGRTCCPTCLVAPLVVFIVGLALVPAGLTLVAVVLPGPGAEPADHVHRVRQLPAAVRRRRGASRASSTPRSTSSSASRCRRCWASRWRVTLQQPFRGRSVLDRHPDPAVGAAGRGRGHRVDRHLGREHRSAQQRAQLAAPDRRLPGLPRPATGC